MMTGIRCGTRRPTCCCRSIRPTTCRSATPAWRTSSSSPAIWNGLTSHASSTPGTATEQLSSSRPRWRGLLSGAKLGVVLTLEERSPGRLTTDPPTQGETGILFLHAAESAIAVDVVVDGAPEDIAAAVGNSSGTNQVRRRRPPTAGSWTCAARRRCGSPDRNREYRGCTGGRRSSSR